MSLLYYRCNIITHFVMQCRHLYSCIILCLPLYKCGFFRKHECQWWGGLFYESLLDSRCVQRCLRTVFCLNSLPKRSTCHLKNIDVPSCSTYSKNNVRLRLFAVKVQRLYFVTNKVYSFIELSTCLSQAKIKLLNMYCILTISY